MTKPKYHSPKFEFGGIPIPEFDVESGKLIRLCMPNFDLNGNSLVHQFRHGLLAHFEKILPNAKWSKEYTDSLFRKYWISLTVENYISKKLHIDSSKAKAVSKHLELDPKEKICNLMLAKNKALAIKCDFEKYNTLIFDYYGVGANQIEYLERIVDSEIVKGKSGIVMDRLEFNQSEEKNKNIERVKITLGNNA